MATFKLQRITLEEDRFFSKRGKIRNDKRRAYAIKQQQMQKNPQPKSPASTAPKPATPAVAPKKPQVGNTATPNLPVHVPSTNTSVAPAGNNSNATTLPAPVIQQPTTSPAPVGNSNQQGNTQLAPVTQQPSQVNPPQLPAPVTQQGGNNSGGSRGQGNTTTTGGTTTGGGGLQTTIPVGPFPTGQQGTTGSVDWGRLGGNMKKWVWKKAKPLVIGAGLATAAAAAGTAYAANKAGKAIAKGADELEDRLEENRRWRREEKMAKRLLKAGYNPYQEGQRIGGYAFTSPYPGRLR